MLTEVGLRFLELELLPEVFLRLGFLREVDFLRLAFRVTVVVFAFARGPVFAFDVRFFAAFFLVTFFFAPDFFLLAFFFPAGFFLVTLRLPADAFFDAAFLAVDFLRAAGFFRFLLAVFFAGIGCSWRTEKRRGLYIA